jgi:hypothetical protein
MGNLHGEMGGSVEEGIVLVGGGGMDEALEVNGGSRVTAGRLP